MKIDERRVANNWAQIGWKPNEGFLTWSLSLPEFTQLIEKNAFQVSPHQIYSQSQPIYTRQTYPLLFNPLNLITI